MAHGGTRPGAGRKPGSVTKKTREIANRAVEDGITPLEFMLKLMREPEPKMEDGEDAMEFLAKLIKHKELQFEAAKAAAPFVHPKLSSIEMDANVTNHEAALDDLE